MRLLSQHSREVVLHGTERSLRHVAGRQNVSTSEARRALQAGYWPAGSRGTGLIGRTYTRRIYEGAHTRDADTIRLRRTCTTPATKCTGAFIENTLPATSLTLPAARDRR